MSHDVQVIPASKDTKSPIRRQKNLTSHLLRVAAYCRVSTDHDDQINSYKSQVHYYTDLITHNPDWELAGIYADEGITGTQVFKREEFKRMIEDCLRGEIDLVLTKSISRFARNTVDTLHYVRKLREHGVAVLFEDENINTSTMDGELLLTVLSSVAQQEVANISANVTKGLKMKMARGELVGRQACYGYSFDEEQQNLVINDDETEIVRFIFTRYAEGLGVRRIAQELYERGIRSATGNVRWSEGSLLYMLANEKYVGDLRSGKYFTLDPMTRRKMLNFGEADQYFVKEHHPAIISRELWEAVQTIREKRKGNNGVISGARARRKFSREYAFSSLCRCGFCDSQLIRQLWNQKTPSEKAVWICATKKKKSTPHCKAKGFDERLLEEAFLAVMRELRGDNDYTDDFLATLEKSLEDSSNLAKISELSQELNSLEKKKNMVLDLYLSEKISPEDYEAKYSEIQAHIEYFLGRLSEENAVASEGETVQKRISDFRKVLSAYDALTEFDRTVFENVIEEVIIGGYEPDGTANPYQVTFVFKTGLQRQFDGDKGGGKKASKGHSKPLPPISGDDSILYAHSANDISVQWHHR